jgi:hypothetical protein
MLKTATKANPALDAAPVYPDDMEPALQDALALLANIDAHYDAERERLELWSGASRAAPRRAPSALDDRDSLPPDAALSPSRGHSVRELRLGLVH